MRSLGFRLTLAAGLVLVIFIAASAFALERAFRDSARSARQERLLAQVYLLMAGAEVNDAGQLTLTEDPPEPRLGLVGSGLYAAIVDGTGKPVWHSRSTLAAAPPTTPTLAPGTQRFETVFAPDGTSCFVQSFGVRWATPGGAYPFTFSVAENLDAFEHQLGVYRRGLLGWLGGMGLLLLAVQWLTLRWGLRPLRRVADELTALEDGRQSQITGDYPTELQRLTSNLNTLLTHERTRQQRYRDTLADLAHSLKTPLAVLRGALREGNAAANQAAIVDAQVERMDRIVGYHLHRAATSGRPAIGAAHQARPIVERLLAALGKVYIHKTVEVELSIDSALQFRGDQGDLMEARPIVERLLTALGKVYVHKPVDVELSIDSALQFRGDEGDLMEALGNVLDNAFKWCRSRVRVSATLENGAFRLTVDDDGPGIDDAQARHVLERGARIDASVPGHGLGLAVSRDIAESCGGAIAITRSALGGAAVTLRFPSGSGR